MKNVSTAFRQAVSSGKPIYARAKVTLSDGTELSLTSEKDFFISGNSYSEGGSEGFMLGEAICKTINISIDNNDERYSGYDFYKAKIILYSDIDLDGATESIKEGIFTVIDSVAPGDVIEFSAYDNMYKTDTEFKITLRAPFTVRALLSEIGTRLGLQIGSLNFLNCDFEIKTVPSDYTARQLIGFIAQISNGNAYIDSEGCLRIKSYNLDNYNAVRAINGGVVGDSLNSRINGGSFADIMTELINVNSGELGTNSEYHLLCNFTADPEIGTDDITITGLSAETKNSSGETVEYIVGDEGYVLKIDNPLISGSVTEGLKAIGQNIIGLTVRPFSGSFAPNPTIECMDTVLIADRKFNIYQSLVTLFTYNYLGESDVENTTESPERNGAVYSTNASAVYRQVKELIEHDKSEWEKAVENLTEDLSNASGLYETQEVQADGSTVYYFHDKSTLQESQIVIKITAQAIGISVDGGETYPTGITVDGRAILNEIYSIGINADFITTGEMSADRIKGGTLQLGGEDDRLGKLEIFDKDGNRIGYLGILGAEFSSRIKALQGDSYSILGSNSLAFHMVSGSDAADVVITPIIDKTLGSGYQINCLSNNEAFAVSYGGIPQLWIDFENKVVKFRIDLDMNENTVKNAKIENSQATNLNIKEGLTISNNTSVDCYSDIDMHGFKITNIGDGLTGTVPFVKDIQTDSSGAVTSWEKGTLTFRDGLLVGW